MPLQRCQKDGRPGWKWGSRGTCYTGRGAREKALRQGRAVEASKHRRGWGLVAVYAATAAAASAAAWWLLW